jgi:ABC-type nitrate/sulfonate/bicarbonate transport system permease component
MIKPLLAPLGVALTLLAGWEIYCRVAEVSALVLPPPSGVLKALAQNRREILPHAVSTLGTAVLGFALSVLFAFVVSALLHGAPRLRQALMPLFVATQTIPLVALAPLMILWFGFGLLPKVILVILVTFLPMLMSLLSGYGQIPRAFTELLTAMGASRWQIFRRATLPAARGSFFAGLRISATYAIVGTIFAEYAGARQGLGIYILSAKNNFRADLVLAAVVVSAVLTLTLLGLLRGAQRLTARGPEVRSDV